MTHQEFSALAAAREQMLKNEPNANAIVLIEYKCDQPKGKE
jgi:hypothetical protein